MALEVNGIWILHLIKTKNLANKFSTNQNTKLVQYCFFKKNNQYAYFEKKKNQLNLKNVFFLRMHPLLHTPVKEKLLKFI